MGDFNSNADQFLSAAERATARALEIIGGKAETYAKGLCPVDTGRLRNSITHTTQGGNVAVIGSNVTYAPYVELGTGRNYSPPPEWIENNAPRGHGTSGGQKPQPYLRPAILEHKDEYKEIWKRELNNNQ